MFVHCTHSVPVGSLSHTAADDARWRGVSRRLGKLKFPANAQSVNILDVLDQQRRQRDRKRGVR